MLQLALETGMAVAIANILFLCALDNKGRNRTQNCFIALLAADIVLLVSEAMCIESLWPTWGLTESVCFVVEAVNFLAICTVYMLATFYLTFVIEGQVPVGRKPVWCCWDSA